MTKLFKRHSSITRTICLSSLFLLGVPPALLRADTVKTDEWQIEADKVLRFENPKSVIAEGHVVLTKLRKLPPRQEIKETLSSDWAVLLEEDPNTVVAEEIVTQEVVVEETVRYKTEVTIKADWIAFDVEQNTIKAKGNVSIINDTDQLNANEGTLNLDDETGTFKEATILRDALSLHLEGETIEKTGMNTYSIENGWVVTCKVEEGKAPPWSFAAKKATVTQGEYAVLKHATFRIKDVPVLYTPWIMLPISTQRQTGFLFPDFSKSNQNGFGVNLPLFVNISDSSDLTLYPEYYANRGFMPGMEFRYTLDAQDKGAFMGSYLDDDLSDPSETDYWNDTGYTHTNKSRYWARGKVDHDFENGIVSRLDMDIVSDRDYLTEFNSGITGFQKSNDRFRDVFGRGFQNKTSDERVNSLKLLKSWDGIALEGVVMGINDVRQDKSGPNPLWKLPSLDFTGSQPLGDTTLTLDWDTDYVYYHRDNGVGGHRVDLFPRLSAPLPLGPYLESRIEGGIRDTFYSIHTNGDGTWDEGDTPNRFLGNFHTEVGTTLLKDYALSIGDNTGFTHNIRPYVEYDYISNTNQDDLPDFDIVDRIEHQNRITYGVDNFFDLFGHNNGNTNARDYGSLKIKQSYDMRSEESDTPFSEINVKLYWNPMRELAFVYKTDIDVYGDGVTFYGLESYYSNSRGDYLNLDYRYDEYDDIHQLNVSVRAQLLDTIFAGYELQQSLSESRIIEQNVSLIYNPACWSVELKSRYTPGDHIISVLFNLANIGIPLGLDL